MSANSLHCRSTERSVAAKDGRVPGRSPRKRQVLDCRFFEKPQRGRHLLAAHQAVDTYVDCGSCALKARLGAGADALEVGDHAAFMHPAVQLGQGRDIHTDVLETRMPQTDVLD